MVALRIEPADDSPLVILNREEGRFEISGKSMPEDVVDFYEPVREWLKLYSADPLEKTAFDIKLVYFNTASSRFLLEIFLTLLEIRKKGFEVLVRWHYMSDDEDMQESGQEYAEMVKLDFEYLTYD